MSSVAPKHLAHAKDRAVRPIIIAAPTAATDRQLVDGAAITIAEPNVRATGQVPCGSASTPSAPMEPPHAHTSHGALAPSNPPRPTTQGHTSDGGFDPSPIIASVAVWEDLMETRRSIGLRTTAAAKIGVHIAELDLVHEHFERAEHLLKLRIAREWRKHPLAPWAKSVKGLGEHSVAVLIAYLNGSVTIAAPKWWEGSGKGERHLVAGEPYQRTVRQLWAYCGVGDATRKRREGMSPDDVFAMGKPLAKSRCRLIAESFIKANNPRYRAVYDARRAATEGRPHTAKCPQCHAKEGDPWKPGHSHADALRIVAKTFLADLYAAELAHTWHDSLDDDGEPGVEHPLRAQSHDDSHPTCGAHTNEAAP